MNMVTYGNGTKDDPWILKTPPLTSEYQAWRDESTDPPTLVVQVGKTRLSYQLRCIEDLHAMLKSHDDWLALGNADEGKPVKEGTVEAWARDETNPVGGYYGCGKGIGAGLPIMSRPCSSYSGWSSWNTMPATIASGFAIPLDAGFGIFDEENWPNVEFIAHVSIAPSALTPRSRNKATISSKSFLDVPTSLNASNSPAAPLIANVSMLSV